MNYTYMAMRAFVGLSALFVLGYGSDAQAASTSIMITELMYNPNECSDSSGEWVELYNAGSSSVNLDGWRLEDTPSRFVELDAVTLSPGSYYIVARTINGCGGLGADQTMSFALNNSGDTITLRSDSGSIVDQVVYSRSAASAGRTIERIANASGQPVDTDSISDWTQGPVDGTPRSGYTGSVEPPPVGSGGLKLTEIMFNPSACFDSTGEWIELYNAGTTTINLQGWRIHDAASNSVSLASASVAPGEYYIVARSINGCGGLGADQTMSVALNNSGDTITLRDDSDTIVDEVQYGSNASPANVTIERIANSQGEPVDTDSFSDWRVGVNGGTPRSGYASSTPPQGCSSNTECGGDICCGGQCVTPVCTTNLSCGSNATCQNPGTCEAACASNPPAPGGDGFKFMSYNVEFGGTNPAWKDVVKEENPDVAVFVEVGNWDNNNNSLLNQFVSEFNNFFANESPYQGSVAQGTSVSNTGLAIMTRFPIINTTQLDEVTLDNGSNFEPTHPLMVWELDVNGRRVFVVGVYMKCCGSSRNDSIRDRTMEGLINHLDGLGNVPLVLLGDFNAVSPSDTDPSNPDYNASFEPAPRSNLGAGPLTMLLYPQDATFGNRSSNGTHTFRDTFRTLYPTCGSSNGCCGNGQSCSDSGSCVERGYTYIDGTFDSRIDFIIVNEDVTIVGPATVGDSAQACVGSDHFNVDVILNF